MYYYLNQTKYPHVPYPTITDIPELTQHDSTVCNAGCGLCAASMVVANLTGREFPLIDCLELSLAVNANHGPGTDMDRLAPYVAERFDLDLVMTDDPALLRRHLIRGGMAIANTAGDRPEEHYIGVFSHIGHYVVVADIDADQEHITVLDPSQTPDKYQKEGRVGKVFENGYVLRTTMAVLTKDCEYREMEYYPEGAYKSWLQFENSDIHNRYYLFSLKDVKA